MTTALSDQLTKDLALLSAATYADIPPGASEQDAIKLITDPDNPSKLDQSQVQQIFGDQNTGYEILDSVNESGVAIVFWRNKGTGQTVMTMDGLEPLNGLETVNDFIAIGQANYGDGNLQQDVVQNFIKK